MIDLAILLQVVVALGIFNVWIVRRNRPTPYRPQGAKSIADEFRRYGLPDWVRVTVGVTKVSLAILLVVGIWLTPVAPIAAALLAALMVAAIAAHVRVGDPLTKSAPAAAVLVMASVIVAAYTI